MTWFLRPLVILWSRWIVSLFAFRDVNDSSTVTLMKKIQAPQPVVVPVFILTPRRQITEQWWKARYAPDYKGTV